MAKVSWVVTLTQGGVKNYWHGRTAGFNTWAADPADKRVKKFNTRKAAMRACFGQVSRKGIRFDVQVEKAAQ